MQCCFSLGKLTGLHWPRGARADDIHIGVTRWIDPVTYNLCIYLEESRMSFIEKTKVTKLITTGAVKPKPLHTNKTIKKKTLQDIDNH